MEPVQLPKPKPRTLTSRALSYPRDAKMSDGVADGAGFWNNAL